MRALILITTIPEIVHFFVIIRAIGFVMEKSEVRPAKEASNRKAIVEWWLILQERAETPDSAGAGSSISVFQNYTAAEVFVQGLAGIVNQGDVEHMIRGQKQM